MGKIIETSIRTFHKIVKRGLIPHPATITRLCVLAGVKGIWAKKETCPKVSPLTLTRVIKGPKNRKKKKMEIMEVAEEPQEEEDEPVGMEQIPVGGQLPSEDEMQNRMCPMIHSPPDVRKTFSELEECSRSKEENAEIMNMLVPIKKEMEEREKRWEHQHKLEKNFWKLNSEEESKDGNNYSSRGMKSGRKKWRGEKEHLCKG